MPRSVVLKRVRCLVVVLLAVTPWASAGAADRVVENGQFRLVLDDDNSGLPASLQWQGMELLDATRGLGWSFTSFEGRSKIYHDENRHVWAGKDEPRFVTDVGPAKTETLRADGCTTVHTAYVNSFAAVERRIVLDDAEPRCRIECSFRLTRRVVIHEPDMFQLAVQFAPALAVETLADVRQSPPPPLVRTWRDSAGEPAGGRYVVSLLPAGPMLVQTADAATTLAALGAVVGDLPEPMPARPLVLEPDARLTFTIDLRIGKDAWAVWEAAVQALPKEQTPAALVRVGDALAAERQIAAAEAAYLEAGRLDATYATPYARIAASRRDHPDVPGTITEGEAFIEGAYRQPYDFGYILSGRGICDDVRLTEEERRLAIFNMLIAVENAQFYPDFYCWAARSFEKMEMYAQACAIYRQALWAADHMPRPEQQREKHRELCRRKIAELEKKLVGGTITDLPRLIPIRVRKQPAAEDE
jgi:hypothetical protein